MFLVSNAYVSTSSGRVRQGNSACVMSESSGDGEASSSIQQW